MSRRSTRLQSAPGPIKAIEDVSLYSEDDSGDFSESTEEEETELAPKKKRRKGAKPNVEDQKGRKVRGRRGLLSSLKEFPLDVLFEIFGHLNPMDLLNLARTSKDIRGILMARSAAFIWRESRTHIEGLPDIPRDLCEPQYANLVFDGHCHQCLASPVQTVIWSARTRMCKKCIPDHFASASDLIHMDKLEYTLLQLVPSFEERRGGRRGKIQLYSIDLATKLSKEAERFRVDQVLQLYGPACSEWRKRKREEIDELNAHAELCTAWAAGRMSDRSDELDDARRLRREAIVGRLTALGWGEEIPFHTREFNWHKLVKQPKELTDRIWKNIQAPMIEFLTEKKKTRLEAERIRIIKERCVLAAQTYRTFLETFPADALFPPMIDMISTEPFRAVIEDTSIYPEEKVTEASFAAAILQVPQLSIDWKRRKDQELVEIMKDSIPNAVESDLYLATTYFACSSGDVEPISYPHILVSTKASTLKYGEPQNGVSDVFQILKLHHDKDIWNANRVVRFHRAAFSNIRSVVEACGLDSDVTTAAEMDEINPVMECLNCGHEKLGRLVMRWTRAATHLCRGGKWKCLKRDEELLVEAQERRAFSEAVLNPYSTPAWQTNFCCKFCDHHAKMTLDTLKAHVKQAHNVESLSLDDVKYHLDVPICLKYPRAFRFVPPVPEAEETRALEQVL
ncbi:hypothetical protein B0H11DRAFT_2003174 [Mycena galericulata]|nr:hypothetical protein B0H11DRAFT_2003174 [Mycena galericulata]